MCVFVALIIQHPMHMRHIILPSMVCPAVHYFSTLSHTLRCFRNKVAEQQICFFYFLHNFCVKHFSIQEELSDIPSKLYIGLHVKYLLFCPTVIKFEFSWQNFRKILKYEISLKSVQWEPSCSEGSDDHDEANSRFSQFWETTKNGKKRGETLSRREFFARNTIWTQ